MPTLQEEFICTIADQLQNLGIKFLSSAQKRFLSREDEITTDSANQETKEYGLCTDIPSSLTDSDEYWRDVATKGFPISTQFASSTFSNSHNEFILA
jgi:hypothetical protein